MSKAPAFQLYAADFYMDTNGWTPDEVGIYFRLLMHEWVNGDLPDDTKRLASIAQCSYKKFQFGWEIIAKKFIPKGKGLLINKRLEETRKEQEEYYKKVTESGRLGGLKTQERRRLQSSDPSSDPSSERPSENKGLQSSSSSLKNKDIYTHFFEDFWKEYPKRNGKIVGRKECLQYIKFIKPELYPEILKAVKNYAESEQSKNGYCKDPIRFLKKDFWKDWLEPENKQSSYDNYGIPEAATFHKQLTGDPFEEERAAFKRGELK